MTRPFKVPPPFSTIRPLPKPPAKPPKPGR